MAEPFIPPRDADALLMMQALAAGIAASPATYQVSNSDANTISAAVDDFAAALAVSSNPATRNDGTILAKDEKRHVAEQLVRQYAILIKYNSGISNQAKVDIGVKPVTTARLPRPAPSTSPMLNIVAATPGVHTLRYVDSMTPDSKRKPFGVAQLQVFVTVSDAATVDADAALYHGSYTRNPVAVGFDEADDGKVATYFGRWLSPKGDVGPWSVPVSMRIAA